MTWSSLQGDVPASLRYSVALGSVPITTFLPPLQNLLPPILNYKTSVSSVHYKHSSRFPSITMINNIFSLALICLGASQIDAFPHLKVNDARPMSIRAKTAEECPHLAMNNQVKRQLAFDPKTQYVSTTGQHAWVAPNSALGDQRGPCPGLNALANHG